MKRRFNVLLNHFKKENAQSLKGCVYCFCYVIQNYFNFACRSGLEEEYDEKMQLLQDISDITKDFKEQKVEEDAKKQTQTEMEQEQAKKIRQAALTTFKRSIKSRSIFLH